MPLCKRKGAFPIKVFLVTNNTTTDDFEKKHAEFIASLTKITVTAFKLAEGDQEALEAAVKEFVKDATAANLSPEEIEDILGVKESNIMDLAELSEDDEEIVIDMFETLVNI